MLYVNYTLIIKNLKNKAKQETHQVILSFPEGLSTPWLQRSEPARVAAPLGQGRLGFGDRTCSGPELTEVAVKVFSVSLLRHNDS